MDGKTMTTTSSTWRRMVAVGCLGAMSLGLSGCSVINGACRSIKSQECLDDFMIGYRNRALAAKAWHRVKHCYQDKNYYNDFKAGFFDGYADVASGGPGCIPAVAPTTYWGWRYQSRDGQAAVNAYFEGYPLGVKAAEQDGVGHWNSIRPNVSRPQQPQPFVPAPIAGNPDDVQPRDSENPFYPPPEPESTDVEEVMGDEELDLGDDPSGAIERALEEALQGDDSVQYRDADGVPLSRSSVGDELVPRQSAEYEIADRRGAVAGVSAADSDDASFVEDVFGTAINAPQVNSHDSAADVTESDSDEIPFVFE